MGWHLFAAITILFGAFVGAGRATADDASVQFFESKIRPILAENCYQCHSAGAEKLKGGLRLDFREAAMKGGEGGAVIVPGHPEKSRLIEAINYTNPDLQMPPKGKKLAPANITLLAQWIAMGAPMPGNSAAQTSAVGNAFDLQKRKAQHWAWQPVRAQRPPSVKNSAWLHDPIDRFILAKLEAQSLQPAPAADRRTLIRRVSFDLTGLPSSPEDVEAFVNDASPKAFEKVVDRLLASPQFGERWARHWLDLVRYAETYGHEFDYPIANAWRYRDYLIRAFNADVPYNLFVVEHLAGDLLANPRRHPTDGSNESIIGTGFWFFGEQTHAPVDVRQHQADCIDNQIDVMGKTFLGLTLGCARCHDHKFDAISTKDVYALWGFVQSSRRQDALLDPQRKIAEVASKLKLIRSQADTVMAGALPKPAATKTDAAPATSTLFADFDHGSFDGWFVSGEAFGEGPTRDGQWDSLARGAHVVQAGVAHSGMLSPRLRGVLRSPTFTLQHPYILYRLAGEKAKVRLIIDGYIMDAFNALLFKGAAFDVNTGGKFVWHSQGEDVSRYVGHRAHIEIIDDGDGWVAVDEIRFADKPVPPQPAQQAEVALTDSAAAKLGELAKQMDELSKSLPEPTPVIAMTDGNGIDQAVYIRGNPKTPGEVSPRRFLEAIDGAKPMKISRGSGRLELSRHIVDPSNPLTARVMVNRLWQHLFGRGIVATVDNFGVLGERPTHPELLDYLADRFVKEGWSVKKAIREMVLSATYQMSSQGVGRGDELDPDDKLLHRARIRRLEGEAIRDEILAVSGRIDTTMFGPSVDVFLTPFMDGRGKPGSGPLDGNGRRSVYLSVRRNFLQPMFLAFDTPIPFNSAGRRNVSNVPAQALILMNDPFVVQQAQFWAQRELRDSTLTLPQRVARMYETAFARQPSETELNDALAFLDQQAERYSLAPAQRTTDPRVWFDFAHVLMNVKEFVFIN